MPELKHYTVINRKLVESFARQLGLPVDQERTTQSQLGISGKVSAGLNKGLKQSPLPPDDPRLLQPIIASLRDSGQLRIYRPETLCEYESADPSEWYVYETGIATPVLVPFDKTLPDANHLPDVLTVWVIDPIEPSREPVGKWDWLGSYVFLVEELADFGYPTSGYYSGISALRMLVEVVAKDANVDPEDLLSREDVFGRWHEGHPVEKLKRVGAIARRPRKIET